MKPAERRRMVRKIEEHVNPDVRTAHQAGLVSAQVYDAFRARAFVALLAQQDESLSDARFRELFNELWEEVL